MNLDDPFSSVRLNPKTQQQSIQKPQAEDQEEDPFDSVRVKSVEGFPGLYETGRHAARLGSRIAETIGGIPGDVQSLIQSGVFAGLEKLTGIPASDEARKQMKGERAPTSKELKELSEEVTGGLTKAQGGVEESIDEFVQTAANLLGPMKFRKALGVALGSQAAKEGLKIGGLGEGKQEAGKLGTMFLLSAMNPGGAMKYAKNQFEIADNLARGASINAVPFEGHLVNLVNDLKKGVSTASKNTVIKPAEELIKKVKNGKILVRDLTAAKRDINSLMGEPETLHGAKKLLKVLGKEVDKAIKPFEAINPAFAKAYRPANEIYGAVMQGNKAANFIKKIVNPKSALGSIIGETVLGHPEAILPTLGIGATSLAGAKSIDFIMRLGKSPELRKYYAKALSAAAREDVATLRMYENKVEDYLENQ